jgi:YD repeat-containing protein
MATVPLSRVLTCVLVFSPRSWPYSRSYQYAYSPEGLLSKITDPAGGETVIHFEEGRLVKVTDPRGAEEHYAYNAKGLLVQVTDKAGYTSLYNGSVKKYSYAGTHWSTMIYRALTNQVKIRGQSAHCK